MALNLSFRAGDRVSAPMVSQNKKMIDAVSLAPCDVRSQYKKAAKKR
jgi:hypothetical protein